MSAVLSAEIGFPRGRGATRWIESLSSPDVGPWPVWKSPRWNPGPIEYLLIGLSLALLVLFLTWGRKWRRERRNALLSARALDRIPDAVLLVSRNGILLKINRIPYSDSNRAADFIGRPLSELPVEDPELARALAALVNQATPAALNPKEIHLSLRPNRNRHALIQAAFVPGADRDPDAVLLVISDTTAFELAQQRRIEVERKHKALIEQLPAIIYTVTLGDPPRTTFISPHVETLLGFTAEEWMADPDFWIRQLHPEDRDMVLERVRRSNDTLESFDLVYRTFARDGRTIWVQNRAVYLPGSEHQPTLAQGVMLDITARKEAETALEESAKRELQLLKMEALGRLAGGISHDMNNLLTPILGFSRLIRNHPDLPESCAKDLDEVIRAAERGMELPRHLLAFGRKQPVEIAPVNINRIVSEMEPILLRTLGEDISLQIHLCDSPWMIQANASLLEQVLLNLSVNARDAMPSGGTLQIETARGSPDREGDAQASEMPDGPFMRLIVRDTGHGMDDEVRKHIFEPFFTTKSKGAGTGLGLPISYGIIRRFGGILSVDSEPGQGTAVSIRLPAQPVAPQGGAPDDESRNVLRGGSETILIAEDEHSIRRLTVRILRDLGYRVVETTDGIEALETARRMNPPPDLLVTDVVMPRMGGTELVRKLRERRPDLPVLFVTGFTPEDVLQNNMPDSRASLLLKPYSQRDLSLHIRKLLDA